MSTQRLNDRSRLYIGFVIAAGMLAAADALYRLFVSPVTYHWFILAGLTLLSGSFTVRIPTIAARLSVSEVFVFAAVLLFGSAAATMIVVLDAAIISLWLGRESRRLPRVAFNMAAPAVAIWIAAHVFYWLVGTEPLPQTPGIILAVLFPLVALAVLYFLLNSWLIAVAVGFETSSSPLLVWRQNFLWLSLNYFSGASVAALLLPYLQADYGFGRVIGVLLPLLLISYLTFKTALGRVEDANRHLSQLNRLYLSTIETLAMAIDAKDQITHGHIRRVQTFAVRLAKAVGVTDAAQIKAIEAAALLHDMGKLAVPEYILNKPGALTAAEFEKMKLHASVGADILSAIDFPYPVVPIVRHHHENWDGSGYPDGLSGTDIPIGARVLSVVDCFDALTSDRPYRPRLSEKDALQILVDRRGQMYDPLVVDTFLRVHTQIVSPEHDRLLARASLGAITEASIPATQNAPAIARLEDISASTEEMLALFSLTDSLSSQMTFADVADVILKHLRRIVPTSLSVFFVNDLETGDMVALHAFGEHASYVAGLRIPLGQRLSGWVGANRQTIRNSDPVLDLGESARAFSPRPRSCISTPLICREELVGVLTLYSTAHEAFTADHQRFIEVVARRVSPVLRQARISEATRRLAFRDQLTGLPNVEQLREFSRAHEEKGRDNAIPFAVLHIDVHNLKGINAIHGRDTGDRVINHIAKCCKTNLRPADVLFRYASDELVAVLFQTDLDTATYIAASVHRAVDTIGSNEFLGLRPNALIAVATCPADGDTVEAVLDVARGRQKPPVPKAEQSSKRPPQSIH